MSAFLQVAVAQAAIAISVFNLMIYLWLGLTVLLNGNRQQPRDLGWRDRPAGRRALLPLPWRAGWRGRAWWAFASGRLVAPGVGACVYRAVPVGGDGGALR